MNDDQLTAHRLDCKNLDCDTGLVITKEDQAIRFRCVVRWWLVEGKAAVPDDVANLIIANAMPAGGLQNPNNQ